MDAKKLKEILDKHLKWLRREPDGKRADLSGAYLSGADLSSADLSGANLSCANLSSADLSGANLSCANLSSAYLSGADLSGADLSGADLSSAYLSGADLSGADLSGADLSGAKIELELLNKFYPIVCPEAGAFIAWKKCRNNTIVKLEVTENAKRSSAFSRKCRCSEARVLAIEYADGKPYEGNRINSQYDDDFWYVVGETVKVDDFDDDRRNECAHGIHFFITRQEAVEW